MKKGSGMTPVRRKNDNRTKVKEKVKELEPGDLVLCKIKGLRQWPGKIIRPEDWERTPEPEKFLVKFFGTSEIAFVSPADIRLFTSATKRKLLALRHSKMFKYFCSAVDEICEAFESQLKNCSSDPGVVNDGKSIGLGLSSTVEAVNCGNLKHPENQLKNSSCDPKDVNDGNSIILVSSSAGDTKNHENFEHHETIYLDAQLEKRIDIEACHSDELHDLEKYQGTQLNVSKSQKDTSNISNTRMKNESHSDVGTSKAELVSLVLASDTSCLKEKNSISPHPCINQQNGTEVFPETEVNEAQPKSPLVSGGKPLGGNEGNDADLVDNEPLAIVLYSKKGGELQKPAEVNVCKKRKPISEAKVNVLREKKNLKRWRRLKVYSTEGGEKSAASCEDRRDTVLKRKKSTSSSKFQKSSLSITDIRQVGNNKLADAAVALDRLEGLLETLSRTKESIGRATRLAIGCAKYGIASEVIDLIIRKLEGESSFPRKVDLFFLVDSITQCSHKKKRHCWCILYTRCASCFTSSFGCYCAVWS